MGKLRIALANSPPVFFISQSDISSSSCALAAALALASRGSTSSAFRFGHASSARDLPLS
jgi:hypothetical protein